MTEVCHCCNRPIGRGEIVVHHRFAGVEGVLTLLAHHAIEQGEQIAAKGRAAARQEDHLELKRRTS